MLALLLVLVLALSLAPAAYATDGGTETKTYTVTLDKVDLDPLANLSLSSSGGSIAAVNGAEETFSVNASEQVKLTVNAGEGYEFKTAPTVIVKGSAEGAQETPVTANEDGTYTIVENIATNITVTVSGEAENRNIATDGCTHVHTDECYTDGVLKCTHEHDGECGYEEETEALSDEEIQTLIDEFPAVEQLEEMTPDKQVEYYDKFMEISDALEELPEEEQKSICEANEEKLTSLGEFFDSMVNPTATDTIYLNGVSGDDNGNGLQSSPVKTLDKAIELLGVSGGTIIVTGSVTLSDTKTYDGGGRVTVQRGVSLTKAGLFEISGGAAVTLTNITIDGSGNWTNADSPLIRVTNGTLTLDTGATLQNNNPISTGTSSTVTGGAVSVIGADSQLLVNNGASITGCGGGYGGAVYVSAGGSFEMSGGAISGNPVNGVYVDGDSSIEPENNSRLTMSGGVISSNSKGGVTAKNGAKVLVYDGEISGNSDIGISAVNGADVTISGGKVSNNTAYFGAGCFVSASTLTISGGEISDNKATEAGGGGVYIANEGRVTLSDGKISGNYAAGHAHAGGGGVMIGGPGGSFYMTGGEISKNECRWGSAVYLIFGRTNFYFSGGKITENKAEYSGTVYNSYGTVTISGGEISNNEAVASSGGGVYSSSGTINMSGGSIFENTAAYSGGGIYLTRESSFNMSGGAISDNSAGKGFGNGVFVSQSSSFNLSGTSAFGSSDDVALQMSSDADVESQSNPYINVTGALTSITAEKPLSVNSVCFSNNSLVPSYIVENEKGEGTKGTRLVRFSVSENSQENQAAAVAASSAELFVPGAYMKSAYSDAVIGHSRLLLDGGSMPYLTYKATYTVTYKANGGTGTMNDQLISKDGVVTLTANAFTRTGYTFTGWNTAADGSGTAYADGATLNGQYDALTLYAVWTEKKTWTPPTAQTKTYNGAAQSFTAPTDGGTYTITYKQGDTVVTAPTNAGSYDAVITRAEDDTYKAYSGTIQNGLVITPAELTITADDKTMVAGGAMPTLTYSVSGLQGSDSVNSVFKTAPTLLCSADGKTAGNYVITVYGADAGSNYNITYVSGKLTVTLPFSATTTVRNGILTGDDANLGLWAALLALSALGVAGAVTLTRRRKYSGKHGEK